MSAGLKLLVHLADDRGLDRGQALAEHVDICAEGGAKTEDGPEVEAEHDTVGGAELTGGLEDHVPDAEALDGPGRVYPVRARFARGATGLAVVAAPAEVPLGEGGETFFSVSRSSAGPR